MRPVVLGVERIIHVLFSLLYRKYQILMKLKISCLQRLWILNKKNDSDDGLTN